MKIETGNPKAAGRYACFVDVDIVPTIVRVWLPGTGWLSNLKEPICGIIIAWIGPLPNRETAPAVPVVEFDL